MRPIRADTQPGEEEEEEERKVAKEEVEEVERVKETEGGVIGAGKMEGKNFEIQE